MEVGWEFSLFILCGLSVFVSVLILFLYVSVMNRVRWIEPEITLSSTKTRVSVIIPARNEEQDLSSALDSVLQQEGVDLQVILVNDHSTDRTRDIADEYAARDPRLTVIHDPELRPGWLGKVNALQHAFDHVKYELVLFTDADVIHA